MSQFAKYTDVPVSQSRNEIEKVLTKYGATGFIFGRAKDKAMVGFEMNGRHIKFVLPVPSDTVNPKQAQLERTRWRCLLLAIKAKLECAASGITTFEQEFMAHIVMPDGLTVAEHIVPRIASAYQTGQMPPLLGGRP